MAELSDNTNWFEVDASNVQPPPAGWPTGMQPNQVEPTEQAAMGALKRFWNRINGTVTTTGSAGAYIYTPANATYPTAYVHGETFLFKANFNSVGNDTLNINGLGPKNLYAAIPNGVVQIQAGQIIANSFIGATYDSVLGGFIITEGLTYIGHGYMSSIVPLTSAINAASTVASNITSLVLPAGGFWFLSGEAWWTNNSIVVGTDIALICEIGNTSATIAPDVSDTLARNTIHTNDFPVGQKFSLPLTEVRLQGGTTAFLTQRISWVGTGSAVAYGKLTARR